MHSLGCQSLDMYLAELEKNEGARQTCERLMSVSISRFFRDRKLWEILQSEILPKLIASCDQETSVWVAGCASGEEVYSFRIVWDGLSASFGSLPDLQITATDMNPAYLERAKAGAFPSSSLRELPEGLKSVYFIEQPEKEIYSVISSLKQGLFWQIHNLLFDPPGFSFDIIFMRNNLLTYYQEDIKTSALIKVIGSLSIGGYLIIGSHEKLPFEAPDLVPLPSLAYVFKKSKESQ